MLGIFTNLYIFRKEEIKMGPKQAQLCMGLLFSRVWKYCKSSLDNFSFGHSFFNSTHIICKISNFLFLVFFLNNVKSCLKNKRYHISKMFYLFILISKSYLNVRFTSNFFYLKLSKYNSTLPAISCLYYVEA